MKLTACIHFIVLGFVLVAQTGCVLFPKPKSSGLDLAMLKAQGYSIPPGGMPSPVPPDPEGRPRIVLEIRSDERHLEGIPMPENGVMFIEDLVQQAKLHEKFGQLSISIMRPLGDGAPPARLDVRTNEKGKATNIGQNYALHAGDHVIVISDERTFFERFMEKTVPGR
jgi:hypothetical protein